MPNLQKTSKIDITPAKLRRKRSLDLDKALKLRFVNGLTEPEIASYFGVSKQAVNQQLMPFRKLMAGEGMLKTFENNYDRILTNVSMILISDMLDPAKREKASLNNVAYAFTQINQALRLHRGESTLNVDVSKSEQFVKDIERKKQALLAKRDKIIDVTPAKVS